MSATDVQTRAAATDIAVFVVDPQGQVTSWGTGAVRLSGRRAEETVGQHFSCLYENASRSAQNDMLGRAARDGSFSATASLVHTNGSRLSVKQIIEPLRDAAGAPIGFAVVARDLNDHARIAHEWNNVLQVVQSGIQALSLGRTDVEPRVSGIVDMLKRNIDAASGMMRQLLGADGEPIALDGAAEAAAEFAGLRVLLVEDESLIALHAEELLTQLGCEVIATASSVAQALQEATGAKLDLALLDINLRGEKVYAVATALEGRGVPLVFMSGDRAADPPWVNYPTIHKPFHIDEIRREIGRALRGA